MMRRKMVRLSDEEHSRLKKRRDRAYGDGVPLGFVILEAIEEVSEDG